MVGIFLLVIWTEEYPSINFGEEKYGLSAWVKGKFSIHCFPYCGNEGLSKLVDVKMNLPLDRIPCSMDAQFREHKQSIKNLTD